ncbi:hypothetical protein ABT247_23285 [Kitasatospora sp. NPDC001539]|uniref:hypothetical protein n=1 Tax=Kitasatospora sp. NPDC001539 TaxID=3154384 RepID=UPI003324954D
MAGRCERYEVTGHPVLDAGGVTVWQEYGGRMPQGHFSDGWHKIVPDPRCDDLLPLARRNPQPTDDDLDGGLDGDLDGGGPGSGSSCGSGGGGGGTVRPEALAMLMDVQRRTRERGTGR